MTCLCLAFLAQWAYKFFRSGHVLFSNMFQSAALVPLVVASCFTNLFGKVSNPSFLPFIFEHSVSILHKVYSFNWHMFSALPSLLSCILHYWYVVNGLKIIIYNNNICFCLKYSSVSETKRSIM